MAIFEPEALALAREAVRRYHNDPVLHRMAYMAADILEEATPTIRDEDGRVMTITGAGRDDWLMAASVALLVAERYPALIERGN